MNLRAKFHAINQKRSTYFTDLVEETGLSEVQIEILVALKELPDSNTFTDILKTKDYAKSYISNAITALVERGYVAKQGSLTNKKVYRLFLLEESQEIIDQYYLCVAQFQRDALHGVSQEDRDGFCAVLDQMESNLNKI